MDAKQLLEEIKARHLHQASELEKIRDSHEKGSAEYAFREGQINIKHVEAGWCEDTLSMLFLGRSGGDPGLFCARCIARQGEAWPGTCRAI